MIDTKYFREYRNLLGFSNQNSAKSFFGAKDIHPSIDYQYIDNLNKRLKDIIIKLNSLIVEELKVFDIDSFYQENIDSVFHILRENNILIRLNNQGRRKEEVYFSWMRGLVISVFFQKAISIIFGINENKISIIGDDDLKNIENFKRTPKADLELKVTENEKWRIEVQSGFQGINDIKQHKVLEAQRAKIEENISSMVIHFDLFNGQVAFIQIDEIEEDSVNWITRQQMEGQTVFNIDQNYFIWKLTEQPPKFKDIVSLL